MQAGRQIANIAIRFIFCSNVYLVMRLKQFVK